MLFFKFSQLCLHKSRLSSDVTGVPVALEKKKVSRRCCEINVSVPWLGGLGWHRQADVSLAALKQLHK